MVIKKKKHICSTRGCRNRDTVMFAKFSSTVGVTFICKQCVDELAAWYGNASGDDADTAESAGETEENVVKVTENVIEAEENVIEVTESVGEATESVDEVTDGVEEAVQVKKATAKKSRKKGTGDRK